MEFNQFINSVKKNKQTIISIMSVVLLFVILATFIQPLKYRAATKLLIVQNDRLSDAYTVSRSNQFLSNILAQVVYSNSFFEQVLTSGYNVNENIFSTNQTRRMKQWQKIVSAKSINDTGMVVINCYHKNKYQASQINQAIAYILKTKHNLYHGFGNKVSVKVIDQTTLSNWPVKPNIILNIVFGVLLGLLAGLCFIYLYPDKEISIWPKLKNKKKELPDFNENHQLRGKEKYPQASNVDQPMEENYRQDTKLQDKNIKEEEIEKIKEAKPDNLEIFASSSNEAEEYGEEFNENNFHEFKGNINNVISEK